MSMDENYSAFFAPSTGMYVVGKPKVVLVSYANLLRMEVTALGRVITGFIMMGRRFGSERVAGLRRNTQCTRIEPTG